MKKYVGIIYNTGRTSTDEYSARMVGAAENDLLRDQRVANFKTGFDTEEEAKAWADNNA
jgi:hypothetical protein